jgi:hypothetical protein
VRRWLLPVLGKAGIGDEPKSGGEQCTGRNKQRGARRAEGEVAPGRLALKGTQSLGLVES